MVHYTIAGGRERQPAISSPGPGGPAAVMIMPMRSTLSFCDAERAWLVETIEALVRIESPTTDKAAVDRCGAEVERRLLAIGARVARLPQVSAGDHVRAEFGAGAGQILLLGHLDTVWPVGQIARMPLRHADGRLHGPGTYDMKAGVAIAMLAVRALYDSWPAPGMQVVLLLTSDEETGSATSRALIEDEARRSRAVLVFEPALPGGAVKTARKGCGEFSITVGGVTAHAGIEPGKGANAIHELAEQILALERLQDPARGVSVNVNVARGGTRTNVIAGEATADVDVRAVSREDAARVEAAIRALRPHRPGTSLSIAGGFERPPLERSAAVARLYELARQVGTELGMDLGEGSTGGGSDGNFTAALGVPTLDGLGAVGDGAHALHEHVDLDSLALRAALAAGLMARVSAGAIG
jgi:glutamate carboxypeptidase